MSAAGSAAVAVTAAPKLQFRILGPLEVWRDGARVDLGARKQRAVLALLLLNANRLVPTERLIDALWGDTPPETARSAIQVYVAGLRKALGGDASALRTTTPGYMLNVEAGALDLDRFTALRAQAEATDDEERRAALLREALELWRDAPLADLSDEPFAASAVARLEEQRLEALEQRIEADLSLGRHGLLVPELEALVAEHPYRERLHAQLMLALYRSGRQAEALETYRRARRALAEELGIDPGRRLQELERAILRHDASLEPSHLRPPVPREALPPRQRRTRRTAIAAALAGAVALALAAAVVVAFARSSTSSSTSVRLAGNSVAIIDTATNSIVGEVPVGGRPTGVAVAYGSVWVGNRDERTLLRIDARSRKIVHRFGLGFEIGDVAAGAGSIWVVGRDRVLRVDPGSNGIVDTIPLPPVTGIGWSHMAFGGGGVWVARAGTISRIDPSTNRVAKIREDPDLLLGWSIAYGEGALWALADDRIERIDPKTNEIVDTISHPGLGRIGTLSGVAAGGGAVWTGSDQTIFKLDPGTGRVIAAVSLGYGIAGVAFDEGDAWVAGGTDTVLRVDLAAERVVEKIPLGVRLPPGPTSATGPIAVDEGVVWVPTVWP
jgi:YVTN family beta-propeller protein